MESLADWERNIISYFYNFPHDIEIFNFKEDYFTSGESNFYKKIFRYLIDYKIKLKKDEREDQTKLLDYMSMEEANRVINYDYYYYFDEKEKKQKKVKIQAIQAFNIYSQIENARGSMIEWYCGLVLKEYKKKEKARLDTLFNNEEINQEEHLQNLIELDKLTIMPEINSIDKETLDKYASDSGLGVIIQGFEHLTEIMKIEQTDLITVGATSGFGKSAFLLNLFKSLSQDETKAYKCMYFNLEIDESMFYKRLIGITSHILIDDISDKMNTKEYIDATDKIISNDSFVVTGSITVEKLKSYVLSNLDMKKINVIFIDHIGLLKTENKLKDKDPVTRTSYCIETLRAFALDNNILTFVASQFNRDSIKQEKIGMYSLKNSGEIENSSTHVLLLKESKREINHKHITPLIIDVAKNRNGITKEIDCYNFNKANQWIYYDKNSKEKKNAI